MSYLFDANNERITGAFTSNYDLPVTLACWVKKTTSWSSTLDGFMQLSETALDSTDSITIVNANPADRFQAVAKNSADVTGAGSYDAATDEYDGVWVLAYGIFTSSTLRRGGLESWANSSTNATSIILTGTLDQIMLGNYDTGAASHLDGWLAECCMWNIALDQTDIDALQTGAETGVRPNTIQSANVIGYWPLDAANSTQSNEGSDTGGDLTVTGATYSADHPTITGGAGGVTLTDSISVTDGDPIQ